ncbi:hypothetical protein D917_00948 [Trichinella nativa]|uniref:Uncharacterized protein n=1 Tax=Trichinella nativa TaxID=6335 RepID=A0A1Y3EX74_9BILA|nr:hypothetical protein D917_00948 [Trichinella nativa]
MQKFLEFWERSVKTEARYTGTEMFQMLVKIDCPVTIRGALSGTVPRTCLVTCFVKKPCPKPGCGKQQHALLYATASEPGTEEPAPEKRYFPDRPCPTFKISENSMAVSSLLVTGSWQILISRDFCDALGLKDKSVVTAAQRKSVSM